jgi:hypothetical protein
METLGLPTPPALPRATDGLLGSPPRPLGQDHQFSLIPPCSSPNRIIRPPPRARLGSNFGRSAGRLGSPQANAGRQGAPFAGATRLLTGTMPHATMRDDEGKAGTAAQFEHGSLHIPAAVAVAVSVILGVAGIIRGPHCRGPARNGVVAASAAVIGSGGIRAAKALLRALQGRVLAPQWYVMAVRIRRDA